MFTKVAEMITGFSSLLENFFVAALKGVQTFTQFMAEGFETIWAFIDIFGFLIIQLAIQFFKLFLLFLPGLLLSASLYWGHYIIGGIGIFYVFILLLAIFGFKTIAQENGSIEEMPENWLWYFPYSWLKMDFLRKKLGLILHINKEITELSKGCDTTKASGKAFQKLSLSVSKKMKFIRKNIKVIRASIPSHFDENKWKLEFQDRTSKYLDAYTEDFITLQNELKSIIEKIKEVDGSIETSDKLESEIEQSLKNMKSFLNTLETMKTSETEINK